MALVDNEAQKGFSTRIHNIWVILEKSVRYELAVYSEVETSIKENDGGQLGAFPPGLWLFSYA